MNAQFWDYAIALLLPLLFVFVVAWFVARSKHARLFTVLAIFGLMFVSENFSAVQYSGGGLCSKDLAMAPTNDSHFFYDYIVIGFPSRVVSINTSGCFEFRKTDYIWNYGGMIFNLAFFMGLGFFAYGVIRSRRRQLKRMEVKS